MVDDHRLCWNSEIYSSMLIMHLILALLIGTAHAQGTPQAAQQVVQQELVKRLLDEIGKAISCQVDLASAKAELETLKKPPEPVK